jgi:MYXO-CTERM domain-containing protein
MSSKFLHVATFAVTSLLAADVAAEVNATPVTVKMIGSSPTDFAPVTAANGSATPPVYSRLRKTKDEQPGEEMAHLAMFADGIHGLYFSMSTDLVDPANGSASNLPTDRIQLALVPFALVKNTDGSIGAQPDFTGVGTNTDTTGGARFVTSNRGNEYRNANHPIAYAIDNGNAICAEYNYQPNNVNNTQRYMECFNTAGATVLPQTLIYAKTNDDCSMNQDKSSTWFINAVPGASAGITESRMIAWRGCNGNGDDDGWAQGMQLEATHDATNTSLVTKVTFKQTSDVALCQDEERSHGMCTTSASDVNTAICTWTEGDDQPQREGVWISAIDLTKTGDASIYWKQQIDGKKAISDGNGGTINTYAMRAMHDRIMTMDSTGNITPSDYIVFRSGSVRGNNNTDDGKGGTYMENNMAVIKADKNGMTYTVPLQNMANNLQGLDGTHLGMSAGLFGTTDSPVPGIVFTMGSSTGGGTSAMMRVVTWNQSANTFEDGGMLAGAPYDRHLYSNYLGNNPGNQGRNYSGTEYIKNPFATGAPNEPAYLMAVTTTGKPMDEMPTTQCPDCMKKKLAAFLTIVPVITTPASAGTGSGTSGTGTGDGDGNGGTTTTNNGVDGGELGGCSTTGTGGGAGFILVLGMAALIRRRRSN